MFQHKSIHLIHNPSKYQWNKFGRFVGFSVRSSSSSISWSRSMSWNVVGSSVQQKTSAVTQWYITGFAAQLSGFRRCSGPVNFLLGFKESNYKFRCPYFRVAHADARLLSTSRSVVKKLNYQIQHHSVASFIHEPIERNSANCAMKTLTSAENFTQ